MSATIDLPRSWRLTSPLSARSSLQVAIRKVVPRSADAVLFDLKHNRTDLVPSLFWHEVRNLFLITTGADRAPSPSGNIHLRQWVKGRIRGVDLRRLLTIAIVTLLPPWTRWL